MRRGRSLSSADPDGTSKYLCRRPRGLRKPSSQIFHSADATTTSRRIYHAMIRSMFLAIVAIAIFSSPATCQHRCPNCGRSMPSASPSAFSTSPAQNWAVQEAFRLARGGTSYYRRTGGHPGGACPYGNFTGTGWSSGGRPGTCTPRRPMRLVGDATVRDRSGVRFRVRVWR